ncbi:DUF3152 domain-containing protein [Streptomyces hygroscopicus]|uniref:DUF3152 domain-containing protein n=1 Tax=Streptomyces hygroscopicus TaxID=1912 RepID=UPI0004C5EB73|nr:DUF3152 domain-containing protein [Streptomyces hygroscopicus]
MRRVGKHSARGSQEDRERRSAAAGSGQGSGSGPEFVEHVAPGAAPLADGGAPGTGRRRRAVPGPGAADPAVTAPQGVPRPAYGPGGPAAGARGGHPEQREAGGGWGDVGGRAPGGPGGGPGGSRGPGAPGAPRPPYGVRTMNPPQRPTTGGTGGAAGLMPGPRKEYIEAFDAPDSLDCDGDDVFAAGAPGAVPAQRRTQRPAGPSGGIGGGSGGHGGGGPGNGGEEPAGKGARGVARGGKGRTFTGVAAAAVTTVLAVVVAGQVAGGPQSGGKTQARGGTEQGDDAASRTDDGRGAARATGSSAPVTYDEKMAAVYPLDADLRGSGAFRTVGGHDKAPGRGQVLRYRVDVEKGLPLDGELFAEAVHKTLNDDRSWGHGGVRTFERVSSGHADFVVTLASPGTTAAWCAKSGLDTTQDNVSCDSAATERVMINAYRWARGAKTFGDDKMHSYRQMLINHEVGHRLGHNHELCTRQGALAPVMMQQTKFLSTDGVTCRPNAWPFPRG